MQMQNPGVPGAIGNWDIHAVNGHLFDDARARLPIFDQAVAALVEDIYDRGLDKKVMLIVSGEFGGRLESILKRARDPEWFSRAATTIPAPCPFWSLAVECELVK